MIKKIIGATVLLLIILLTIPATRAQMFEVVRPITDNLRSRMVPGQLSTLADQLEIRYQRTGRLPSEQGMWASWLKSSYTGSDTDPWGNLFYVRGDGRGFTVGSMGPDGEQGTADDMTEQRRRR